MHDVAGREPVRAARVAVTAIFFIHGAQIAGWAPHIATIKDRLEIGDALLGWVLLCLAAGALSAMLFVGRLIDRFGSRTVTIATMILFCSLVNGPINAESVEVLAVAFFVLGAAAGAMDVAMNAHGAAVEARLGRPCMSSMHGGFSLGALAGAALGTAMLSLGFPPWQHVLTLSLSGLAGLVLCFSFMLPSAIDRRGPRAPEQPRRRLRIAPTFLVLGLLGMIAMMAEGAMIDWSAVYMRDVVGATLAQESWAFAGFSLAMATMRIAGDRLNHWFGPQRLFRFGVVIAIGGCALMAGLPGLAAGVVGATMVGVGVANCVPLVCAAAARPGTGGSGMATVIGISYLGFLLGPPLVGGLSELFSLRISIGLIGIMLLVLVVARLPGSDR